jgi:hypothetical protein
LSRTWWILIVCPSITRVTSLPKRLELSFLFVLALPNASRMGSHFRIFCSGTLSAILSFWCILEQQYEMALSASLFVYVLPEPDSPLMLMTWVLIVESRLARMCMMKE